MNEDKSARYHRLSRRLAIASLAWTAAFLAAVLVSGASSRLRDLGDALGGGWLTVAFVIATLLLLHAAMVGQSTRFTRQDGVEETWRIMQPLLDTPPALGYYKPGAWGPDAADALVSECGGWHGPWVGS